MEASQPFGQELTAFWGEVLPCLKDAAGALPLLGTHPREEPGAAPYLLLLLGGEFGEVFEPLEHPPPLLGGMVVETLQVTAKVLPGARGQHLEELVSRKDLLLFFRSHGCHAKEQSLHGPLSSARVRLLKHQAPAVARQGVELSQPAAEALLQARRQLLEQRIVL